ncbi:SDR family NAD(P)-dependent oxidoreductase [Aeromicrobium sp.]|uniref:SDR family NAD(P)-dependent oxidoreductase n=1 Tax=Aeromicrobium sp. TaxID=1871063 RepID=UPI0019B802D8|nr:SDR family NAD(P)-dependent oxidoreductase [Aeromicrobium sp.]MBC7632927.1 SDR family NAD(P)-dependent oxidoreductase [Aeromicrobium sp.]
MTADARVVLITGASSGIGQAVALRAAEEGDHVVLVAREASSLQTVAQECDDAGAASTLVVPTDVGDDAAVERLFRRAVDVHGRVDAVAHCAGVVAYGRTEEVPSEVFEGVLRTNLIGSVNVARHTIRLLREQEGGALVLIGSVIGHIGVPSMSPYVLSKWGVRALARQLQLENRDIPDLHVAYIAPGGVDTPIYEQAGNYAGFIGRPPPPVASPEKVARVVLRRLEHHRDRTQVNLSNNVIRFGFTAMPWAYDLLVGPLFRLAASDRTRPVGPGPGNVLAPQVEGNRLHGNQGNPVIGIGRNAVALARSIGGRRAS